MNKVLKECKIHGMTYFFSYKEGKKNRLRCAKCVTVGVQKRRKKLKQMALEYKGGQCIKCGYNKSIRALVFHHTDPKEKDFGIGANGITYSWKRVKQELDKCDLLCSNCHAEEHDYLESKL